MSVWRESVLESIVTVTGSRPSNALLKIETKIKEKYYRLFIYRPLLGGEDIIKYDP